MAGYSLSQMSPNDARIISRWRYGNGYALHDLFPSDAVTMLSPERYYHTVKKEGALTGFACFGEDARIYGGPYEGEGLDLGCGMAPARCGKGEGAAFFAAVLGFAQSRFRTRRLRLTVPESNRRAITVYGRAGFRVWRRFAGCARGGTHPFLLMVLDLG